MANGSKKVLIVEDHENTAKYFAKVLVNAGFAVDYVISGEAALKLLKKIKYDLVITDWLMPVMDGIQLINLIREKISPVPLIIMITARQSEKAKETAMFSGADEFVTKPVNSVLLQNLVQSLLERLNTSGISSEEILTLSQTLEPKEFRLPPFVAVTIAASTGGPPTLIDVLRNIQPGFRAVIYIVQHGPAWMLEAFPVRITESTGHTAYVAADGMEVKQGCIYLAPGEIHMVINPETYRIELYEGPKENFVIPAADPLFRSAARAFGKFAIGVVLTGLGADGSLGAASIAAAGGRVIVQDPATAIAPSMPRSVINSKILCQVFPMDEVGNVVSTGIFQLSATLKKNNS